MSYEKISQGFAVSDQAWQYVLFENNLNIQNDHFVSVVALCAHFNLSLMCAMFVSVPYMKRERN